MFIFVSCSHGWSCWVSFLIISIGFIRYILKNSKKNQRHGIIHRWQTPARVGWSIEQEYETHTSLESVCFVLFLCV